MGQRIVPATLLSWAIADASEHELGQMLEQLISAIGDRPTMDLDIRGADVNLHRWRAGLSLVSNACADAFSTGQMRRFVGGAGDEPAAVLCS